MKEKKTGTKFTILFNCDDPVHVQAADILNRQPQRGKAHYIAQAIVHYEKFNGSSDARHQVQVDEQLIETVARRMMSEIQMTGAGSLTVPVGQIGNSHGQQPLVITDIEMDDAMAALDEEGVKNMMNALDMFRNK